MDAAARGTRGQAVHPDPGPIRTIDLHVVIAPDVTMTSRVPRYVRPKPTESKTLYVIHREQKPAAARPHRLPDDVKAASRAPVWRPQPSGLTRDELRAIVLEALG